MTDLDLKALWNEPEPGQPEEGKPEESPLPALSAEQAESRAMRFERKVTFRNRMEWVASAFVVLWFGRDAFFAETVGERVGGLMVAIAAVGIALYLWRRGRVELRFDPTLDTQQFVAAHVAALRAQARLLSRAPLWYLAPLAVGLSVLMASRFPAEGRSRSAWMLTAALSVAVFALVGWFNHRGAKKLRDEAAALEAELDAES